MCVAEKKIVRPTESQQKWHDLELGMFFHFDIPVFKQGWEWRNWGELPDPDLYQPTRLDTDQWMEAAKAMGARYAIFVANHCSGFLQWQSDLYPYGVRQSSWRNGKGDVVEDFVESCRKYDIEPGLYASVSANAYWEVDNPGLVNRGKGGDEENQRAYVRVCEQMVEELWSRYGELFEVWFDGGAIPVEEGGPDLIPILKEYQPDAIVFQGPSGSPNPIRWVGNERGVAPYPCWSTAYSGTAEGGTEEKRFAGDPDGRYWIPGECDVPIRDHEWFWKPNQENLRYSVSELADMYYCSVGRNCNLLLNANPNPDGLVPEADMERYEEFGREVKRHFDRPIASAGGDGSSAEVNWSDAEEVDRVVIMEDISCGERILEYTVEGYRDGMGWRELCSGQSIGHKRIERFQATSVSGVRLRIDRAKAEPEIRRLAVYESL